MNDLCKDTKRGVLDEKYSANTPFLSTNASTGNILFTFLDKQPLLGTICPATIESVNLVLNFQLCLELRLRRTFNFNYSRCLVDGAAAA